VPVLDRGDVHGQKENPVRVMTGEVGSNHVISHGLSLFLTGPSSLQDLKG